LLVRNFKAEDYWNLINLWDISGLPYKLKGRDSMERIVLEISCDRSRILIIEIQNQLVASVLVSHDGRKGWINRLAVDPKFRKAGLATILIHEAEEFLSSLNIDVISCLINKNNYASQELFTKEGYGQDTEILYFSKRKNNDS